MSAHAKRREPPPAWLVALIPEVGQSSDYCIDYGYEEHVARMTCNLPASWVRDGLARLVGGGVQDRLLVFADKHATDIAAHGWALKDLFPTDGNNGPCIDLSGLGWPLVAALDSGGKMIEVSAARIVYATVKGVRVVIERPR